MFVVYGKSLKREQTRIKAPSNTTPESRFRKQSGAYPISPVYSCEARALEFVELSKKYPDVRCQYIARLEIAYARNGEEKINKKTGQPKTKYKKFRAVGDKQ